MLRINKKGELKMKKRLLIFVTMIIMMFSFCACEFQDEKSTNYNGYSYNDLKNQGITILSEVNKIVDQGNLSELEKSGQLSGSVLESAKKWKEMKDKYGEAKEIGDFHISKAGDTLTTKYTLRTAKRDIEYQVIYDYNTMKLKDFSFNPIYSLGEKLKSAGRNTIVSVIIVFAMLTVISIIISCFKFLGDKPKKDKESISQPVEQEVFEDKEDLIEDTELVAVIAAAIASYEQISTNDFVVRKIKRR